MQGDGSGRLYSPTSFDGTKMEQSPKSSHPPGVFLPELCNVQAVLLMVIATGLCALLFTLIYAGPGHFDWDYFALTSLFMLWVVLTSALILCRLRILGASWSMSRQALVAYLIAPSITLVYAILANALFRKGALEEPGSGFWFVVQAVAISAILTGIILRYFYLQHLWHLQQKSELESRVQALQARIRPHFLFNSMNSIAGLIPINPNEAEEAVLDLAELFRAALKESSSLAPLKEELALCERYLRIEQLRLGERLTVKWDMRNLSDAARVPPLSIQPLVENAVYHGVQPSAEGGLITITAYEQGSWLYVLISNPVHNGDPSQGHKGNRIAMQNIRSRLQAFFGDQAVLKTSQMDGRFTATMRAPLHKRS
ncbi:sensor histidine kinase [Hahella sp. HN01]|nr:sensor histidine kinase [Hahella sp. HN01]